MEARDGGWHSWVHPTSPDDYDYLRLAEPKKPAEWKAGDTAKDTQSNLAILLTSATPDVLAGYVVREGLDKPLGKHAAWVPDAFTPYTPTPDERIRFDRIVKNAKLKAEWEKKRFAVEYRFDASGMWHDDDTDCNWAYLDEIEYRRKPEPRFVPWTAEDDLLGVRIRQKDFANVRATIHGQDSHLVYFTTKSQSYEFVFNNFVIHAPGEQLDSTPCGKEVAE